ncbi:MAG: hypothetical protein WA725_09845, partial [Pseudolabrys sp.]
SGLSCRSPPRIGEFVPARLGKTYQIRGGRRQDKNAADDLREQTSFSERSEDVDDLGIDHALSHPPRFVAGGSAAALALSPACSLLRPIRRH